MLFGTDSHTCNAGAFGQFATGIGNTDASFVMGTGKLLIKVSPLFIVVALGKQHQQGIVFTSPLARYTSAFK